MPTDTGSGGYGAHGDCRAPTKTPRLHSRPFSYLLSRHSDPYSYCHSDSNVYGYRNATTQTDRYTDSNSNIHAYADSGSYRDTDADPHGYRNACSHCYACTCSRAYRDADTDTNRASDSIFERYGQAGKAGGGEDRNQLRVGQWGDI